MIGWILLIMDSLIATGNALRRFDGKSGRLVAAEDAHLIYGGDDEKATAAAATLGFLESNPVITRIVGQEGRVNAQIRQLADNMKRLNLERAKGVDLINRNPDFDSADSLVDKLIKKIRGKAEEADLKGLADRAAELVKERTEGTGVEVR